jgi:hypothetical protein
MPLKKRADLELPSIGEALGMDPTGDDEKIERLESLLRRVGVIIRTINMSGKKMDNRCRLCPQARLLKVPCPHEEIWSLTK